MKKTFYFLIFLALWGCCIEEPCPESKQNCTMIQVSAALPIKMYLNGETAFNDEDHDGDGIEQFCFNQEFECDDEIKFQFIDPDLGQYQLVAVDDEDNELINISFESGSTDTDVDVISVYSWDDIGGGAASWVPQLIGPFGANQVTLGSFQTSNRLQDEIVNPVAGTYNFLISADGSVFGGLGYNAQMTIYLLDEDDNILVSADPINILNTDLVDFPVSLNSGTDIPFSVRIAVNNSTGSSNTVLVRSVSIVNVFARTQVYDASIIPSEFDICNDKIKFRIYNTGEQKMILKSLSQWENLNNAGPEWNTGIQNPTVPLATGEYTDALYTIPEILSTETEYSFDYDLKTSAPIEVNQVSMLINLDKAGSSVGFENIIFTPGKSFTGSVTINVSDVPDRIRIQFLTSIVTPVTVTMKSFKPDGHETVDLIGFTEFVNFRNQIAHNIQVRYKGIKPYAGLYHTAESSEFMTRIPGRFFHPRKSGQTTSIELSNNKFITTSSVIQKKRLFEIEDAPEYFHDMIELILNHAAIGYVQINGVEWERAAGDDYVYDEDTPEEYPLIRATVVLSRKDWIKRNVT